MFRGKISHMKAWVLRKPDSIEKNPIKLENLPVPEPLPGEVVLEVTACGVCHTDLHAVEGDIPLPLLPLVPGHQVVGRVVETGTGTKAFKVGDRAGLPWLYGSCGVCPYCKRGAENLCSNAQFTGLTRNGGYAEYIVGRVEYLYKIPKMFDDLHAAPLLCAGVIGFRALRTTGVKGGGRLGLFGFGSSAHITLQVAVNMGIKCYVFSRSPERREHALRLGAAWAGGTADAPPVKLDGAISFSPAGAVVPPAMERLDKGGTLAVAGIYVDRLPEMDYQKHLFNEKVIRSVTAFTRDDAAVFLKEAAKARVKANVEVFPFAKAPDALKKLKEGKIQGTAVLSFA